MTHFHGDPLAAREILVAGALRVEHEDRRRAADLMASALHSSFFCERSELVRETAATAARLAMLAGVDHDVRLSAITGAALTICERLDAAAPYLRRSIELRDARGLRGARRARLRGEQSRLALRVRGGPRARSVRSGSCAGAGSSRIACLREPVLAEYQCALGSFDAAGTTWAETIRAARRQNSRR